MFWDYYEDTCIEYSINSAILHAIINVSFGAVSLTIVLIGIWRAPKRTEFRNETVKMEHRLALQTLLSSTMLTLTFLGEYFFIYFKIQNLLTMAYIFYILEFYPPIFVLFYASTTFRREYLTFYRLDSLKKLFTRSSSAVYSSTS